MAIKSVTLILNGVTHTLVKNTTTGKYEKTITAPSLSSYNQSGGYYPMQIKAEDMAGNITTVDSNHVSLGAKMKLAVKEKVAPNIAVTTPGVDAYLTSNTVSVQFDITDNDSGVNSISLQVDSQAAITSGITKTAITKGYRCTYTATIADGKHTIKINASDNDGNVATQKLVVFTVDTVPPTLDISYPAATLITNKQVCIVTGVTNDATSAPCTIMMKLNNVDQGGVTVNADGSFSKSVTLIKGSNTLYVKSTDKAGKSSEVSRIIEYDPDSPVIMSIDTTPNPVDAGMPFVITADIVD